jgi:ABC-type sugar transport system ATPase subunit
MSDAQPILKVSNIESYYGPIMAIRGVSLSLQEGRSSRCWAPTAPARPPF